MPVVCYPTAGAGNAVRIGKPSIMSDGRALPYEPHTSISIGRALPYGRSGIHHSSRAKPSAVSDGRALLYYRAPLTSTSTGSTMPYGRSGKPYSTRDKPSTVPDGRTLPYISRAFHSRIQAGRCPNTSISDGSIPISVSSRGNPNKASLACSESGSSPPKLCQEREPQVSSRCHHYVEGTEGDPV